MNKYYVSLTKNYNRPEPFMTGWDYEMIGDRLREEFDEFFKEQEKAQAAGLGKTRQLLKADVLKRFMISKRINLVDDPATGNLKSVFVLKPGEKKLIDQRAKESLAFRYEYKTRKDAYGNKLEPIGFLKFELVEGSEDSNTKQVTTVSVSGSDLEYFDSVKQDKIDKDSKKPMKEELTYVCDDCGKMFENARALNAHSLSHLKEKEQENE